MERSASFQYHFALGSICQAGTNHGLICDMLFKVSSIPPIPNSPVCPPIGIWNRICICVHTLGLGTGRGVGRVELSLVDLWQEANAFAFNFGQEIRLIPLVLVLRPPRADWNVGIHKMTCPGKGYKGDQ